jgi:hypothetical protein
MFLITLALSLRVGWPLVRGGALGVAGGCRFSLGLGAVGLLGPRGALIQQSRMSVDVVWDGRGKSA